MTNRTPILPYDAPVNTDGRCRVLMKDGVWSNDVTEEEKRRLLAGKQPTASPRPNGVGIGRVDNARRWGQRKGGGRQ